MVQLQTMEKIDVKNKDKRLQEIKTILSTFSEETVFILTSHLLVEKYIDELLEKILPNGSKITNNKNIRFTFLAKCEILESMKLLNANSYPLLKELNSLRNKFSHKISYKISKKDIDNFIPHIKSDFRKKMPLTNDAWSNFEILKIITYYIFGLITATLDANLQVKIGKNNK